MNFLKTLSPLLLTLAVLLSCGLADKAEQVTQLARSVEQAQESLSEGDTSGAFGALFGGGEAVEPVDFRQLMPILPENLPGLERTNAGGEKSRIMGMGTSKAEGEYRSENGQSRIDVTINDLGSVRGIGVFGFNWLMMDVDKATDQGYERTLEYEGNPAYIKFEQGSDWSRGQMSVFVADRFVVTVEGSGISDDALQDALGRINLRQLEAMKDDGVGEGEASENTAELNDFLSGFSNEDDAESQSRAPGVEADADENLDGRTVEPIDFRELRQLLPDEIEGLARANTEGETGGALGVKTSSAVGTYQNEDDRSKKVTVKIFDSGTLGNALMLGGYAWLAVEVDKENDQGHERTLTYEGYPAYEKFARSGSTSRATMQTLVGRRFVVEIEGQGVEMETIRSAMALINLNELDAMKTIGITPES